MPVKGVPACRRLIAEVLEDGENGLPGLMRQMLFQLSAELSQRDQQIGELDEVIKQPCKADERIKRLLEIEGCRPDQRQCGGRSNRRCQAIQWMS